MIQLNRSRLAADIPPSLSGGDLLDKQKELLVMVTDFKNGITSKLTFNSTYWGRAKRQLKRETFNKCAYCESPTGVVAHGDVEHFRPKSVYWWLAYCYDNYLYSCQICNQSHKGNKFPVSANLLAEPNVAGLPELLSVDPMSQPQVLDTFHSALVSEQADLPNPYYEDPAPYFIWKADDLIGEVELQPNPDHEESERIFKAAKECFGINRKELCTFRYQVFKNFQLAKLTSKQAGRFSDDLINMANDRIKAMKNSDAPYAGMVRYFDSLP